MNIGAAFALSGDYRVQSWMRSTPSHLAGRWIVPGSDDPSETKINAQLRAHAWWRGEALVALRSAAIDERTGAFREPDILYKRSHFKANLGSPAMTTNIVDVRKAAANWRRRIPLMIDLVGETAFREIEALIGDIEHTAADEYVFHEAGHCLGYPTERKYNDGYFRLGGATRWQLIYLEELRADLLAFGLAADALSPQRAAALVLYNLLLRVGADTEARADRSRPYGPIPRLLVSLLQDSGWISGASTGALHFASLRPGDIVAAMVACSDRAIAELLMPEEGIQVPLDAALLAARWLNGRPEIRH